MTDTAERLKDVSEFACEEVTASAAPVVARTRTDLESAEIEIELADNEQAANFFERVALILRRGERVRVRVSIKEPR